MSSEKNTLKNITAKLLNPRSRVSGEDGFSKAVERSLAAEFGEGRSSTEVPAYTRGGPPIKAVLTNTPLVIGVIIVLFLFGLVLFGPVWAPQNPYIAGQRIVPHFDRESGEFIRPPLAPSAEFPFGTDQWGADILSMLMHGARNTLVAGAFITMLRVMLGVILGAAAGWNEGTNIDRAVMGVLGLITSLPILIVAIIFIYALDIRRGLIVFIIALSIIGWTEIAQYVRGEILVLRKMPYIEGARATGLNNLQIVVRHILPNILPYLLIITFLEMGAVLMLLGELGFVGVYIGGGSRIDLTEPLGPPAIFTLPDVPEWGAMIADGFRWLRSKPWVVMPPAVAFFIAVAGFNMLGEGLRRLIERYSLNTGFLLQKRMLLFVGGMTLATIFIMNNTGAAPWFARVAASFSGDTVFEHVETLAGMDGRSVAQDGGQAAAAYIADKFAEYGLRPGGRQSSYYHFLETQLVQPLEQPQLAMVDENGGQLVELRHQVDFGFMIEGHGGSGRAEAPLTFVGFEEGTTALAWDEYAGLDLRGRIVLLQRGNAPPDFAAEAQIRGAAGVIWIETAETSQIRSQIQVVNEVDDYLRNPTLPVFRIRPSTADRLLEPAGWTVAELLAGAETPRDTAWYTEELSSRVQMSLELAEPQMVEVPSVIGYAPGSDLDLADEVVVLFTYYDGLGIDPDGTAFPAVNHNASGTAMLLELARLWRDQELDTRRTTMFVAWGGEGLDRSGAKEWIEDDFSFRHIRSQAARGNISPAILLQLDFVGAGGEMIVVESDSPTDRLSQAVEKSAVQVEVPLILAEEEEDPLTSDIVSTRVDSWALVGWQNSAVLPQDDTIEKIDSAKLQQFGELFALVLTKVARENRYWD